MSTATIPHEQKEAYQQRAEEVVAALGTDARRGLCEAEARARLNSYGKNELTAEKPVPAWSKFLAQFHDVLVILLLIATAVSAGLWVYERDQPCPTKRWRSSQSCCSMQSWATFRSHGRKKR